MPYNVIGDRGERSCMSYCPTAVEASDTARVWSDAGVSNIRVVSVEGAIIPPERLDAIARTETASPARPPRAA